MTRKVAYIYHSDIETFHYGPDHPMKPKKVAMTHDIVEKSHLLSKMDLYKPPIANWQILERYHTPEYLDYIENYFNPKRHL